MGALAAEGSRRRRRGDSVSVSLVNRPDLATMAERLRLYAARWRAFARSGRGTPERVSGRNLIAQAFDDAADLLEARQFKAELGAGIAPPAPKKKAAKPKRVTRRDRVLELLDLGPMSVHDVSIALGIRSRNAYEELIELYRGNVVTRRETKAKGRLGAPPHLYYKP